jgi:predicted GNAT superfamily acetyltransferase
VLHRGTATDRFIARWWIRDPRVERRLAAGAAEPVHEIDASGARQVNTVRPRGDWIEPAKADLSGSDPQVLVVIPRGFTEMQVREIELARAWPRPRGRSTSYFARGYRPSTSSWTAGAPRIVCLSGRCSGGKA